MLISNSFLFITVLVDGAVLLLVNILTLAVFYIFLIYVDGSLTLLLD